MKMVNPEFSKAVLQGARLLIEKESAWIQGPVAVNAQGDNVQPIDPEACAWCCLGAIEATYLDILNIANHDEANRESANAVYDARRLLRDVIDEYTDEMFDGDIGDFNDSAFTGHGDVLHVLDTAIEDIDAGGEE